MSKKCTHSALEPQLQLAHAQNELVKQTLLQDLLIFKQTSSASTQYTDLTENIIIDRLKVDKANLQFDIRAMHRQTDALHREYANKLIYMEEVWLIELYVGVREVGS